MLLKHGDDPSLRTLFVSALAASLGGERAVRGLLDRSGLTDPAVPFPDALDRYSDLAVYLPGTHVLNADWGVGRVTGHDGEFLSIDFQHKRDHRLSLSIAETAISVVPENLVAVAYFEDPEGIERERDENPAALVLRAVQQEGGGDQRQGAQGGADTGRRAVRELGDVVAQGARSSRQRAAHRP
ncbi:MAG: hypothetical protein ACOX6M_06925 [Armatimonadota bacterium]